MSARVGVFGATGYTGREVVRLLRRHPQVRIAFTTGSSAGHLSHESGLEQPADAFLLAMPHGVAASYAARLREAQPSAVVVDLSGDLRLPTPEAYLEWYGHEHKAKHLLGQAVFGLSEVYRERIAQSKLVSNPGCYATSVLLPLIPLLRRAMDARGLGAARVEKILPSLEDVFVSLIEAHDRQRSPLEEVRR